METTEVVIAGAGPTGLVLALELRLAGIDVVLVDALPGRTGHSRAGGIGPRTMEIFDQRGLLERLLPHGRIFRVGHFAGLRMDFGDLPTRYPDGLAITQSDLERQLDCRAAESGVRTRWGAPVTGVRQDDDGVEVECGGHRILARYLVGCDGGRSTVRALAGIGFDGTGATMLGMVADVELADPPPGPILTRRAACGDYSVFELRPGGFRLMVQRHDRVDDRTAEPDFDTFRDTFRAVADTDFGMRAPRWVSRFGDAARLATHYRTGRILLAGDAAHIHYPAGGQGLNTGVQDAVNLGWKLAATLRGTVSPALLDSYESERRPVAARVLHNTRAQTALMRPGPHTEALRETLTPLFELDEVRHRIGLMMTALDIRYEMESTHALAGLRVPDADITIARDRTRIHELLRSAHPVLLSLNGTPELPAGWDTRVDVIEAHADAETWPVPGVGTVARPNTLLIRPDGHVAWASDDDRHAGLPEALATWFGLEYQRTQPIR